MKAFELAQQGDVKNALQKIDRCKRNINQKLRKQRGNIPAQTELQKLMMKALRLESQLYISKNIVTKAIVNYDKVLSIAKTIEDDNEVIYLSAHTLYSLALINFIQNNLDKAFDNYKESLSRFELISMYQEVSEILIRMIDISVQHNDLEEAWRLTRTLERAIKKIKEKDKKQALNPRLYQIQSKIRYKQANVKDGQKLLAKAKKEYHKNSNMEGVISTIIAQVNYDHSTSSELKEDLLLEALELAKIEESKSQIAILETELGLIQMKQGKFEKGKNRLLKGLELKTQLGDKSGTAQSLVELSRVSLLTSQNHSDLQRANEFANQAIELFEEVNNEYGQAQALEIVGTVNTKLEIYVEAIENLRRSRKLFKKYKDTNGEARSLTQLGMVFDLRDDQEQARTVLERAQSLYEKTDNIQGLAEVLQLRAKVEVNSELALKFYTESRDHYTKIIGDREELKPILFALDIKIKELSD